VAAEPADPLTPWLFVDGPPAEEGDLTARSDTEWRDAVADEIVRRGLPMRLLDPPADLPAPRAVAAEPLPLARGPVPERALDTTWGRSSYTRWTHASGPGLSAAALEEGRDTRDAGPELEVAAIAAVEGGDGLLWPEQGPLASFPRGTTAGDCLHRMLEQLDFGRPVAAAANREVVARELRRAGLQDEPLEPVLEGLESLRLTPFGGALGDLRPADLAPERRLSEMAFDLSLGFARADGLAAAFADHPGGAFGTPYARRLAELPVASRGFLTGAIDLIFTAADGEGGQRWWVADWKSNWLGRRDAEGRPVACGPRHYGTAAMAELMAACHYPLQAHLYLVALHRYLAWRLPGYDPAQHLGGYVYVFLRGAPGPSAQLRLPGPVPGMFVERPPLGRVLALDAALGRPASAPATTADGRPPR
jgi:exodeoxyribonuclease V beta subunit